MARVGERLKQERESRNTTIADISLASGIGETYLEALERGEIDALPGPAFGKLYIRAYAEVLEFDAQPWIEDYDRERRTMQGAGSEPAPNIAAKERRVAAAIARWRESKTATPPVAEMEPPIAEEAEEPVELAAESAAAIEPDPAPEPIPEPAPRIDPVPDPQRMPEDDPEPEPVRPPPRRDPNVGPPIRAGRAFVLAGGVLVIAGLIAWIFAGRKAPDIPKVQPAPAAVIQPQVKPAPEPPPAQAGAATSPSPADTAPAPPPPVPAPVAAITPGSISVFESGTGRRIVASKLEGEGTEFTEGDSVVFQTRVVGGSRGDTIRHVWIYGGRAQQSITLKLGSSDWRTHSKKTLYKRGAWTVEARDRHDRVLASASFTCNPAGHR